MIEIDDQGEEDIVAQQEIMRDSARQLLDGAVGIKTARKRVERMVSGVLEEAVAFYVKEARNPKNTAKFRAEMWDRAMAQGMGKPAAQAPIKQTVKKNSLSLGGLPVIPNGTSDSVTGVDLGDDEQDAQNETSEME